VLRGGGRSRRTRSGDAARTLATSAGENPETGAPLTARRRSCAPGATSLARREVGSGTSRRGSSDPGAAGATTRNGSASSQSSARISRSSTKAPVPSPPSQLADWSVCGSRGEAGFGERLRRADRLRLADRAVGGCVFLGLRIAKGRGTVRAPARTITSTTRTPIISLFGESIPKKRLRI